MYQNLTNEIKDSFKPFMNVFDIQTQTAQKMLREQMDFMSECLNVSTQYADTFRNSDDKTKFFRVPVDASREIGERFNGVMGRQWSILAEARDALTAEVQSVAKNAESAVKKASVEVEKAVADVTPKAESSTAKSSGSTARKS